MNSVTISGLNTERFKKDIRYREAVVSNIHQGWAYIDLPEGFYLSGFQNIGERILLTLIGPKGVTTTEISKVPGIHHVKP